MAHRTRDRSLLSLGFSDNWVSAHYVGTTFPLWDIDSSPLFPSLYPHFLWTAGLSTAVDNWCVRVSFPLSVQSRRHSKPDTVPSRPVTPGAFAPPWRPPTPPAALLALHAVRPARGTRGRPVERTAPACAHMLPLPVTGGAVVEVAPLHHSPRLPGEADAEDAGDGGKLTGQGPQQGPSAGHVRSLRVRPQSLTRSSPLTSRPRIAPTCVVSDIRASPWLSGALTAQS